MKLTKNKIQISGMHCSGCVERLTKVFNNLEGVRSAEVSLEDGQAEVTFDEDQTGVSQMKQVIRDAGYEVKSSNNK